MREAKSGVIARPDTEIQESFDDPAKGNAFWFTLFSAGKTPTTGMSAGVMVIPPNGGFLALHRHPQAELYFVAAGAGALTIDGVETIVAAGAAAFIPGNAHHAVRNDGAEELRIFYVFPTDSFAEIAYDFGP